MKEQQTVRRNIYNIYTLRKKMLFFIFSFFLSYLVAIVVQIWVRSEDIYLSDYIIATFWIAVIYLFLPLTLLNFSLVYFSKKHIIKALLLFIPAVTMIIIIFYHAIWYSRPEGIPWDLSLDLSYGQSDHIRTNKFTGRCEYGGAHPEVEGDPWYYESGCQDEQAVQVLQDYFNRHSDDPVQMEAFLNQLYNSDWKDQSITEELWEKSCTLETTEDQIHSCYRRVAIINDNPSLCTFVANELYADCLASYASCQGRPKIDKDYGLDRCLFDFDKTEYPTNSALQKTNINQTNNNVPIISCAEQTDDSLADDCYVDHAVSNKDVTVCQQVTSIRRPNCIHQVAVATKDDSLCDTIEGDQKYSSNCLFELARLKNDPVICDRIQVDNFLTSCKNSFTDSDN